MHARGTAEVLTWPSINHPALTWQGGGEGGGGDAAAIAAALFVAAANSAPGIAASTAPTCAPHARHNIPIKYCLLTQENQKKAKTAKTLFYERSRRHHAAKNCKNSLLRAKPQAPCRADSDGSCGTDSDGS